ncbi:tetratricopeptide repeat protein [bacterium]|nr:tetratricopeptide repeat protein [bacterium]
MKKSLVTFAALTFITYLSNGIAFADFKEHFDMGQTYLAQYQYSGAITEFKSALRINYLDNSARIGLINSYLARGSEFANKDKAWTKASDDFRSALFYMMYYPNQSAVQNSATAITKTKDNLEKCLTASNFDFSSENRFETAKKLRAEGNFSAAGYEFMQALGSRNLQKESFEQIAEIMKVLGNEPKAAEYYKKAIAVAPTDLKLRLAYAKILDNTNDKDEALKEYSFVLQKTTSENKEILYTLERIFGKKLQASPNNANLQANMGAILQKEGRLDEALSYYKQAEALDPSNINTRINTGTLHQQKGDYRTAIKAYESVLILYPDNVNANLYRAQCYDKLGETKIAQEGFKKVLALDPNNDYLKVQMVENAKKTMPPEEFVNYVNASLANMNPADILYNYALELHKNGNLNDAEYMYNSAIKASNGTISEMYVNLALAQAQGKKFDEALNSLQIAKNKFPKDITISDTAKNIALMKTDNQLTKASDAYNNKDYQNAINYYLSITPATVDSMIGAASSYQELGDRQNAIEYYKKALSLKPVDTNIAYYIACLYGENDDYEHAKDYLQKAITFDKNNTQAVEYLKSIEEAEKSNLLNSAIALYDESKFDESFDKFNELLSKDSQNAYALYYRGMIYDTKEKRNEAIADLKKAYSLNNDFTICNYLIASDYDALGKYKDAYNYYIAYANSDVQDDEYKKYAKDRAEELKQYAK